MAYAAFIAEKSRRPSNEVHDYIAAFPDSHIFDPNEYSLYSIVNAPNLSPDDINSSLPTIQTAVLADGTPVWIDGIYQKRIYNDHKYVFNSLSLTPEEYTDLISQSVSRDEKIEILKRQPHKIAADPDNQVVVGVVG